MKDKRSFLCCFSFYSLYSVYSGIKILVISQAMFYAISEKC